MAAPNFILMGKIVGVHGIGGTVKVQSYAESEAFFVHGRKLRASHQNAPDRILSIERVRAHKRVVLIDFDSIEDRDAAEALVGVELSVDRGELPELEDDTYYWSDLIGLSVFAVDDTYLGRVVEIIQTGSNDVYVVRGGAREILIPALADVITTVDIRNKTMRVALPDGL